MSTIIVCVVLALIIIFAIINSAKHFRGEGGCCGGGSSEIKVKKKKLSDVKATLIISVDGMTCKNCSARIQNKLNEMDNVSADVNLRTNQATVEIEDGVSEEDIKAAIERLGYTVTGVIRK